MSRSGVVRLLTWGALAVSVLAVPAPAVAGAQDGPNQTFLRKVIQLDDGQLAAVEKGEVVTKQLPTTDKPEVAAFGIVKTSATVDQLLAAARDVLKFRSSPKVPEMGLFSNPAKLTDLKGLSHPPDDIEALKKCKPGSCDVKLGTKGLEAVSRIDWKAPDATAQASATLNQLLVDYVAAYQQGGTEAMANVVDKKDEKARAEEYRALLAHSPYLVDYEKEFNDYLASYPRGTLAGASDVLYWTKDTYGPKPVVSTYHATFYKGPRGALIANKLIGASHFYNAGLELMAGVPTADGKGLYLMSLARMRLDPPTGMLAGTLMGKVKGGVEQGVKESLKTARDRLAGSATK
jgi:hypothetical protein